MNREAAFIKKNINLYNIDDLTTCVGATDL